MYSLQKNSWSGYGSQTGSIAPGTNSMVLATLTRAMSLFISGHLYNDVTDEKSREFKGIFKLQRGDR